MSLLDIVKSDFSDFDRIDVFPILAQKDQSFQVGWNAIAYFKSNFAISGGTHKTKEVAIRIAIAELLERAYFKKIINDKDLASEFMFDRFPTTCGMACGFENDKTKLRAVAEGLERWVWSKWIDEGYLMDSMPFNELNLTPLSKELLARFEEGGQFYQKKFMFLNQEFYFSVFLGVTENGIFAGSRVALKEDELWEHALIEAYRNYSNYLISANEQPNVSLSSEIQKSIVAQRVFYFGSNKNEAIKQIKNATKKDWPIPQLDFIKEFNTGQEGVFIWRCILQDWMGWHLGDEKRFVY